MSSSPSTRPLGRLAALVLLAFTALLAAAAFVRWRGQLRPAGHAEVALTPLAEHPLEPGRFVYVMRVQGVARPDGLEARLGLAFAVRTRRGAEWSDVAAVTTSVRSVSPGDRRPPASVRLVVTADRWGNEVQPFGVAARTPAWRVPSGLAPFAWETFVYVADAQPEEVEVSGALSAADGASLPFRATALVPERGAPTPPDGP